MTALLTALIIFASSHSDPRWKVIRPYDAKLERIAECESHQRWTIVTHTRSGETYYGGLQFDLSTWRSVGGRNLPHRNSQREQKYRAVLLIRKRGYQPWPRCGSA